MPTHLFFSNNIETLADAFSRKIAEHRDVFEPCTVIVPNPYLQKWLQLNIAETNGIAINLKFRFLDEGLLETSSFIAGDVEKPTLIEQADLQLMLYHSIVNLGTRDRRARPLMEYLMYADGTRKPDYDKKVWQLSSRLARYFIEYELFREDMIQQWLGGKLLYNIEMEAAQQCLYLSVFKKGGYRDRINKNLLTLPQYWNRAAPLAAVRTRNLFLFGKSQLSPFHVRMIYELGKHCNLFIYQVNPCSEFWEDVTTPREDRWNRVRSIRIEETDDGFSLPDNDNENPLLKLWGKAGRETVKLLSLLEDAGSREFNVTSEWLFPDHTHVDDSCLHTVQNQILSRTSLTDAAEKKRQDTSIQIASCPEIFREVEAVYSSILYNLDSDAGLQMTDIAVMVPDMSAYAPVIQSVFSREPKRLAFSIIDSTAATDSLYATTVRSLLEIASGSFTRNGIFDIICNPCFLEAHAMTLDDASRWLAWADALNIFGGFNKMDDVDPERNLYTWQQGLQRLRFGRIMQSSEAYRHDGIFLDYKNIVPYSDMNTGDQHLIDTFNRVIEHFHVRTKHLPLLRTSGAEWLHIIDGLLSDFIAVPSDRPEELQVRTALIARLNRFSMLDVFYDSMNGEGLPLSLIKEFITEHLSGISSSRGGYLTTGINISALIPKRQIPFKIIYVMGMQEGIFPGTGDISTLNLMNIKRRIGDIARPDANRYLSLQTLLSARNKLYITYVSKDLQKDQDFFPNSVVGQLITYLTNHVVFGDFTIQCVPPSGSSEQYIRSSGSIGNYSDFVISFVDGKYRPVNYSEPDRLTLLQHAARKYPLDPAILSALSERLDSKIPDFSIPVEDDPVRPDAVSLSLRDLSYFIINPIESTLRWHLGIHDEDIEDRAQLEDEPFFSVYPYDYRFITDALNYYVQNELNGNIQDYIKNYYRHARLMSITPDGAFGAIDLENFNTTIMERIDADESLSAFLYARKQCSFYQNVVFGSVSLPQKPDLTFPAVNCNLTQNNHITTVELNGALYRLWRHPESGDCETLIITNSAHPSVTSIINPFLFYIAASSGLEQGLHEIVGSGSFTIHVSHRRGISSYRYTIRGDESRIYLHRLLADFLDETSLDLLPLQIIAGNRFLHPADMDPKPDPLDKLKYRQVLIRSINDDAEKAVPLFRPVRLLEIINAEVPEDAYDTVRDRLAILLGPFIRGGAAT